MTVKQDIAAGSLSGCARGMLLESVITCPHCGTAKSEIMPTDACRYLYDCTGCGVRLWAKAGDCCVFCSYGTTPCPPIQAARADGTAASCCTGTADENSKRATVVPGNGTSDPKRLHTVPLFFRILHRRVAAEKRRLSHRIRNRSFVRRLRG
jgi:hypothetical protein